MTDRRDTDPELVTLLSELEGTLTELRGRLAEENSAPVGRPGPERRRAAGRRERSPLPRPPGMREILRFTEQQTIPTLIAVLEANIRLLRLAGAALRAVDPERSVEQPGEPTAVGRAIDAGGRLSSDRLTSGLGELQEALSGTEAPNPEARQLLDEAERLSEEVRERLKESEGARSLRGGQSETRVSDTVSSDSSGPVHIEVEDASQSSDEEGDQDETDTGVDVDAELDSIREEIRDDGDDGAGGSDSDGDGGSENGRNSDGSSENGDSGTGDDSVADSE